MSRVQTDFNRLDAYQRGAVRYGESLAVTAGPGSGKTDTMVLKVVYLLQNVVPPPRGVACITYSNDTAREFSLRLRRYGIRPSSSLFLGTVHSFCLGRVLRPFAAMVGRRDLVNPRVMGRMELRSVIDECVAAQKLPFVLRGFENRLSIIRKARCCGADLSEFPSEQLEIADRFDRAIAERNTIDFDGMVVEAVKLVREEAAVRLAIASRFPWLLIDEYQDLGGPLHELVRILAQDKSIRFLAVGDPDQSIYAFAGSTPGLFLRLETDLGFDSITLPLNYRSASEIIDAGQIVLGANPPHEYRAAHVDRRGQIVIRRLTGGFSDQAKHIVEHILPSVLSSVAPHEVAILYPGKGMVLDALAGALADAGIPHLLERDERFPSSPTIRWLQRAAAWALDPDGADVDGIADLAYYYEELLATANQRLSNGLELQMLLHAAFVPSDGVDMTLSAWLLAVDARLRLAALLATSGCYPDDLEDVNALVVRSRSDGAGSPLTLRDFAAGVRVLGKLAVTTYHGSKGRQFDAVVLPGLQESIMPRGRWDRHRGEYVSQDFAEERRLFYVAISRARHTIYLVASDDARNGFGFRLPESRFLTEVSERFGRE